MRYPTLLLLSLAGVIASILATSQSNYLEESEKKAKEILEKTVQA